MSTGPFPPFLNPWCIASVHVIWKRNYKDGIHINPIHLIQHFSISTFCFLISRVGQKIFQEGLITNRNAVWKDLSQSFNPLFLWYITRITVVLTALIHEQHCFSLRQILRLPHSAHSFLGCRVKAETCTLVCFKMLCGELLVLPWEWIPSSIAIHTELTTLLAIPSYVPMNNILVRNPLWHSM